jgi:phage shock protein PspC (stress-responsive transcriptional regulator)
MTDQPLDATEPTTPVDDPIATDPTAPIDASFGDDTGDATFGHLPPPPMRPIAPPSRTGLVRDPYSRLGGIASGLAHRYGWDPTLVRLLFVVALIASGGGALLLYLVAWLVVPRATVWPPTPVSHPAGGGLSNREIGIATAVAGVLAFLVAGAGTTGAILVPLALIGGGIWLLTQSPREQALDGGAIGSSTPGESGGMPPASPPFVPSEPLGQPVPPRSRRRKWAVGVLVAGAVLTLTAAVVVPVAVVAAWIGAGDGVSASVGNSDLRLANYAPESLDALPTAIRSDKGLVRVDLRGIPASDFAELTGPARLDIALGEGEVWLEIPEGLSYRIDARADDGTVHTDGAALDAGKVDDRTVEVRRADPDLVITIDVNKGDINLDQH